MDIVTLETNKLRAPLRKPLRSSALKKRFFKLTYRYSQAVFRQYSKEFDKRYFLL